LIDNDKSPGSESEMLNLARARGVCDEKGVVPDDNIEKFCALFGIDSKKIEDGKIPRREMPKGEGVLMGCWNYDNTGQSHCVRFCGYTSEGKIRVMNPAPRSEKDKFPEIDLKQIDPGWKCNLFSMRLQDSPKT
jgi:hypothetical protein